LTIRFSESTFRKDFTYRNSPQSIERFPFPFPEDSYMYSVNLEPHVPVGIGVLRATFDIDEHYVSEMKERAFALAERPGVHYVSLPHMMQAQWDLLELIMMSYARDYPEHFSLEKNSARWRWKNGPLGLSDTFTFGDPKTLPYEPLEYIGRQAQGEWVLLEERDNTLFWGAGMATERADYSLRFNLGMSWQEFHGPVPLAHEMGVFERALKFLLRLRIGHPMRRLNWTLTVRPRLETSAETLHEWAPDRTIVTPENAGELVHLRVELQPLHRLPRSNAIVFPVRTYFISLNELSKVPHWARRAHRVFRDIRPELADYKGFARYREALVKYLSQFDNVPPGADVGRH
jgi:hypothetical protein